MSWLARLFNAWGVLALLALAARRALALPATFDQPGRPQCLAAQPVIMNMPVFGGTGQEPWRQAGGRPAQPLSSGKWLMPRGLEDLWWRRSQKRRNGCGRPAVYFNGSCIFDPEYPEASEEAAEARLGERLFEAPCRLGELDVPGTAGVQNPGENDD